MPVHRFETPERTPNEADRLTAVAAYGIGREVADPVLDAIVARAAALFGAPMALVSIIHDNVQKFRAKIGIDAVQTSRGISFCGHALHSERPFIVPDATLDPRFAGNPLVIGAPYIRTYAGAPLITRDGLALGTLCVIDTQPRAITPEQVDGLVALAGEAMARLGAPDGQ